MKTFGTDWRSPGKWTRADRNRRFDAASVANNWQTNPYGNFPTRTLVAFAPAVLLYNGVASESSGPFNQYLATLPRLPFPPIWKAGAQSMEALDMRLTQVADDVADAAAGHFNWAAGYHLDYFTDLAWLLPESEINWAQWNAGLLRLTANLRRLHPNAWLLGQQFHLTPITDAVDGLFVEESPGHFGLSFEDHAENMKQHAGDPTEWVFELRDQARFPAWYIDRTKAFVEAQDCYLALGRDALAVAAP